MSRGNSITSLLFQNQTASRSTRKYQSNRNKYFKAKHTELKNILFHLARENFSLPSQNVARGWHLMIPLLEAHTTGMVPFVLNSFHLFFFPFLFFIYFIFYRISLCSPGWPETHYIDQAVLKLMELCLPLPAEHWD